MEAEVSVMLTPVPPVPPYIGNGQRFETFFDRRNPVETSELAPYTKGTHTYATKQVPSALALCATGNPTLKKKLGIALRSGIQVEFQKGTGNTGKKNQIIPDIDTGLMEHVMLQFNPDVQEYERVGDEYRTEIPRPDSDYSAVKNNFYRPLYEDPFRIIAARTFMDLTGQEAPKTIVWPGDGIKLSDKIPAHLMNKELTGKILKNTCRFHEISKVSQQMHLLLTHTFWGKELARLSVWTISPDEIPSDSGRTRKKQQDAVRSYALVLIRRIQDFLEGRGDPLWTSKTRKAIYGRSALRNNAHRAQRLLEVLRTVDGIFIQRYMAVPEEKWTWQRYDRFVLTNISALIGDEFYDGEVTESYHNVTTRYTELKKVRKLFKDLSNRNMLDEFLSDRYEQTRNIPKWLNWMLPIWRYTRSYEKPFRLAQVDGLLSQTRAAGTPPDLVKMQSKRKFLKTVSESPPALTSTEKAVIRAGIASLDEELDQSIFTGLDTKARVTVSIASCWEHTQEEGGTLQAISEIVHLGRLGETVPKRDLFSGKVTGEVEYTTSDTGTYIFWACLDEVLKADPAEINMAALVMVSEPGKARTVTKSTAALKVVLDVVNKICSWPLTKIRSSSSGMQRASHAWNSFKSAFTEEGKETTFDPLRTEYQRGTDGEQIKTTTYQDVFMSSTDYENATDAMNHEVASMISRYWMNKCGIPPVLQMIVKRTCYSPRPIVFEARGPMATYGEKWDKESPFLNPHFIMLRKGVLMGDPLTKPVLHLVNILVRIVGAKLPTEEFQSKIFGPIGKRISDKLARDSLSPSKRGASSRVGKEPIPEEVPVGVPGPSALTGISVEDALADVQIDSAPSHVRQFVESIVIPANQPQLSLTWKWLMEVERKESPRPPEPRVATPVFNRTVSFKDPRVREVLSQIARSEFTQREFTRQRAEIARFQDAFKNIELIQRPRPGASQSFRSFQASVTNNYRQASPLAVSSVMEEGERGCAKGLLRLLGIIP